MSEPVSEGELIKMLREHECRFYVDRSSPSYSVGGQAKYVAWECIVCHRQVIFSHQQLQAMRAARALQESVEVMEKGIEPTIPST